MHKRYHVQRQHIIHSLDTLLYQLHTLSFFLSPSIWLYVCRIISQFQCSKPRELDSSRSLRFFFTMVVFLNMPSLWTHSTQGAPEGRAIILDFIGMSYTPSRLQLCALDVIIICLQFLLTTIAYETSVYHNNEQTDAPDLLLPNALSSALINPLLGASSSTSLIAQPKVVFLTNDLPLVLDLHLSAVMAHIRHAPPPPRVPNVETALPLPNTTPWPLPAGMRMLMRASRQVRDTRGPRSRVIRGETGDLPSTILPAPREIRIPGTMDPHD